MPRSRRGHRADGETADPSATLRFAQDDNFRVVTFAVCERGALRQDDKIAFVQWPLDLGLLARRPCIVAAQPDLNADANLIFVSIASYRDEQLLPTIRDCIAKAKFPERLRFGICWQHEPGEAALPYADDPRFRILDVDFGLSRGACWARAEIMKLWQGEAWFLQVDSHCRFAPAFDEQLVRIALQTRSQKPILSTYASSFQPADARTREVLRGYPQLMAISLFNPEGIPHLKPVDIPNWQTRTFPMRARFLAAGFLFTIGAFVEEVPYDPELYFFGEEIAMTVRAYTHGYDLFHPHQVLVWHDYVRNYAKRHWDDHASGDSSPAFVAASAAEGIQSRNEYDLVSRAKIRRLLMGDVAADSGDKFGLGSVRSLAQYEAYAGISFGLRKIQDYTRRSLEPPNPPPSATWADEIYPWMVRILIDPKQLSPVAFKDPAFWYVTLQDEDRNEIHRHDFPAAELEPFAGNEERIALVIEFESGIVPVYWTVWPVSKLRGWLSKITGTLQEGDYAIVRESDDEAGPA